MPASAIDTSASYMGGSGFKMEELDFNNATSKNIEGVKAYFANNSIDSEISVLAKKTELEIAFVNPEH